MNLRNGYSLELLSAFAFATGTEVRRPPVPCPGCKSSLEVVTGIDGQTPSPGAYTVCIVCATMSQYLPDMSLRLVSRREIKQMPGPIRKELLHLQELVQLKIRLKQSEN